MISRISQPSASFPVASSRGYGILLTLIIALSGWGLSFLPVLARLGPLACTLLLAAAYRHRFGYPTALAQGIRYSSGTLLRLAIVLFGLKLNVGELLQQGLPLLARSGGTVVFSLAAVWLLGRWLRADRKLTFLLAVGTAICGAAAIAAVSPLLKSKEEDTAMSAGLIALIGTAFAMAYTLLQPWLPLDAASYGIWSGLTLHEIAHVAMAAAPAGTDAMSDGLLAKLCRVALLVPTCLGIVGVSAWRSRRKGKRAVILPSDNPSQQRPALPIPWFLFGFIAMSLFGSYALPTLSANPAPLLEVVSLVTTLLLAMAMAGLGLNVNLRDFRSRAARPFAAMLIASLLLSGLMYLFVRL
ncbi:putative sulfate exporter family transporter [Cohnella endophytica]|uniref:Putative sulfate exporter family transporter n=1 Tax=Cohnella endophytica TaxID=2419778 RepID=A0A494X9Z1_9BACL|nr:putative sulfate exporter family transporter [Cohnella endophytica]RKP47338.1 putative sulfate exporter family transporter [Cohnella endophytica]